MLKERLFYTQYAYYTFLLEYKTYKYTFINEFKNVIELSTSRTTYQDALRDY